MKNSGDKKMMRQNEGRKNKIKACDDLDRGSDEMAKEDLNSGKEKMENTWNQSLSIKNKLQRKGLLTWMK